MCTKNHNHMTYGSWDTEWDRQNFLSFWAIFCPFSPLTTWKIKILKLEKTPGDIMILHICTISDNHMMYSSWDTQCNGQNFLSFWNHFLPFCPPMDPENQNFGKMNITPENIIYHFTNVYHKWQSSCDVWFLRYQAWWTECFVILDQFLPFYPSNNPKIQSFEKMEKKFWRYYHFTHMYHKCQSYNI